MVVEALVWQRAPAQSWRRWSVARQAEEKLQGQAAPRSRGSQVTRTMERLLNSVAPATIVPEVARPVQGRRACSCILCSREVRQEAEGRRRV